MKPPTFFLYMYYRNKMATLPVINFHNEKMAQERARVMLRIANGTKSDSSALIARRMLNRTYQGVPDNSTGSRNMPFFATKNELNTPLEAKISARGGMVPRQPGIGLELPAGLFNMTAQAPQAQVFAPTPVFFGQVRRQGRPGPPGGSPGREAPFAELRNDMDLPAARRVRNAQIANAVEPLPRQPVAPSQVLPPAPVLMPFNQQGPLNLAPHTIVANQRDANPNVIAAPFMAPRYSSPVERPEEGRGYYKGGVLTNYRYARKILDQRKADIENQLREEEGLMRMPLPLTQISELDSRKLELANQLQYMVASAAQGDYNYLSSLEGKQLLRNVIVIAPVLTEDELLDIKRIMSEFVDSLYAGLNDNLEGMEGEDLDPREVAKQKNIYFGITSIQTILYFLKQMASIVNNSLGDKLLLAKQTAKELGGSVGLKEIVKQLKEVEGLVIDAVEEKRAQPYAEDDFPETSDTSTFASGPTSASAYSGRTASEPSYVSEGPVDIAVSETAEPSTIGPRATPGSVAIREYQARTNERRTRLDTLYKKNDIAGLQQLLREVAPLRRSEKFFGPGATRVILKNMISNYI